MNRVSGTFALIVLAAAGIAAAQTPPPPQQPTQPAAQPSSMPSQDPNATTPAQDPNATAPPPSSAQATTTSKADKKQAIKDCISQQQANNTSMSKHQLKKYCKSQVENGSPQ